MKKIKVSQKTIKEGWKNVICIGYCNIQYLLYYMDADFFTARREGWGADIYKIDYNTAIVTGYAPFGNIRPDYDLQQKYDRLAREVVCNNALSFDKQKEELRELLEQFVAEVLENEKNK